MSDNLAQLALCHPQPRWIARVDHHNHRRRPLEILRPVTPQRRLAAEISHAESHALVLVDLVIGSDSCGGGDHGAHRDAVEDGALGVSYQLLARTVNSGPHICTLGSQWRDGMPERAGYVFRAAFRDRGSMETAEVGAGGVSVSVHSASSK